MTFDPALKFWHTQALSFTKQLEVLRLGAGEEGWLLAKFAKFQGKISENKSQKYLQVIRACTIRNKEEGNLWSRAWIKVNEENPYVYIAKLR